MEAHTIRKSYLAIVFGWPSDDQWVVDAPLLRQGSRIPSKIWLKQCIHPDGSAAFTSFQTLARLHSQTSSSERFALVKATPRTGRMHQIRVHLAHSGHPIVGDKIYGADENCYLEFIETSWTPSLEARLKLDRQALHACGLLLEECGLSWDIHLPQDLQGFLQRLTPAASNLNTY